MSWHFSRALEAAFLEANFLGGEPCALWNAMPFAQDDSYSDKMKGTCHHSPFGTMYVPSTDERGAALLMWFRAAFPARPTAELLEDALWRTISGRKCGGSWQMSLPGTYLPRMLSARRSTTRRKTCGQWATTPAPFPLPRETWVLTTYGPDTGLLHTPTTTANYACRSMQKWPNCREFVRVFGQPTPENHEWLMGWPTGWTDLQPLATDRFRQWQQAHGGF